MIYPLGIAFTLLILTVGLYRSIFSKNAKEVDDPFHLVGWSVVAMFLVLSSTQLLQYFIDMMAMAEAYLNSTLLATTDVSSITDLTVWEDLSSTIFPRSIADTTVADSCGAIVSIIFIFLLGWKFLQLMFLYSARYVQYFLVCLLSPLGFSPLASVKTKEITQRYLRLFVSSILSLLLTKIIIYIYSYLMISTISWNASDGHGFGMRIFMLSITLAFYKVAGRIDDYLSQLGLTNVSSANEVPRFPMMAMMAARGLGRMASGTAQAVASGGKEGTGIIPSIMRRAQEGAAAASGAASQGENGGPEIPGMSSQNNAGREAAETAQAMMKAKTGQSGSTPAESAIQKQTEAMSPFLENGKQGEAQDVRFSTGGEDGYMECSGSEAGGYANPDGSALDTAQLGHYVSGDEVAGRNLDPAGDNFGYTLSQNAETDSEGTQTAQGYFLDADGASHEASFTKGEGDSSWQTTMDGKAYDSPAQAAQALDAGSVKTFDPSSKGLDEYLEKNAQACADGNRTAKGYFTDADGAVHGASFTKSEGDSSWKATVDGKTYGSPGQAAQALDAGSAKTFGPSSKGLETQLGKSTQSDAYGNQTAKGYLEGADGRKHEAVYTKSAGEKGLKATVGGREYKSVEEAAKAVGAKSAGVYGKSASAGVYGKGKPATAGVYGKGDAGADGRPVQMSAVAQKGLNPSGKEMARVLDEHSHFEGTGAAASQEAYGSMTDVHGNSHEFKAVKPSQSSDWQAFEKTADGYVPRGSLGTMASDVQAASADVYQAEPGIISAQTIRASGSMANAMNSYNRTAGSGMPEPYLDQRVVSMGNGQVSGVYVDMGGNVKTYSGSVVSQNYAQKTPGNYIKVNDSVVSVRQGTKDAATLNYARSHEYKGGRWMDTGNAPTKLNNDAKARRQKK